MSSDYDPPDSTPSDRGPESGAFQPSSFMVAPASAPRRQSRLGRRMSMRPSKRDSAHETSAEAAADADAQRASEADLWDVVDPAYAAMTTWSNIQDILFGPPLRPPPIPTCNDLIPGSKRSEPPDDAEASPLPKPTTARSPLVAPTGFGSRRGSIASSIKSRLGKRNNKASDSTRRRRFGSHGPQGSLSNGATPLSINIPQLDTIEQQPTPYPTIDPLGATSTHNLTGPSYADLQDPFTARGDISTYPDGRNRDVAPYKQTDKMDEMDLDTLDLSTSDTKHGEDLVSVLRSDDAPQELHDKDLDAAPTAEEVALEISQLEEIARLAQEQAEEDEAVDAYIARLKSPRERFRRGLSGFGRYLKTPMGLAMVMYGLIITAWGIAIFILIVGWWDPPNRRVWIERCDKILCCLFNLTGFLLAPSRARDTYRMIRIKNLRRRTLKRRAELGLPPLANLNDLPRSYAYRLYDTNRRRNLPPAEAAEAVGQDLIEAKGRKQGARWAQKQQAQAEAGIIDRVDRGTAHDAEMRVAEEAAAVAVAMSQKGGVVPSTSAVDEMGVCHDANLQRTQSRFSLRTTATSLTLDLSAPVEEKRNPLSRLLHASRRGDRRAHQNHRSISPAQQHSSSFHLDPHGDQPVTMSLTVPDQESGNLAQRPLFTTAPQGSQREQQTTLSSSGDSSPSTSSLSKPHSATTDRPCILVRSRSEYGAPEVFPGAKPNYFVPVSPEDSKLSQDYESLSNVFTGASESNARLATVVSNPIHTTTSGSTENTVNALTAGAAVWVAGDDGRVAYAVPADAEPAVLSLEDESQLVYQQRKFRSAHPYYRYHETETHRPFSTRLAMAIVLLSDMHSCLQACLCGVTWGINYHNRPTVLTAMIISCSLSCNAMAGVLIWLGGRKTKKTEVIQAQLQRGLEAEARRRVRRAHAFEAHAQELADQGKNPYPYQARGPEALTKLNLYDLNGRHELPQLHGPFPGQDQPRCAYSQVLPRWARPGSLPPSTMAQTGNGKVHPLDSPEFLSLRSSSPPSIVDPTKDKDKDKDAMSHYSVELNHVPGPGSPEMERASLNLNQYDPHYQSHDAYDTNEMGYL